jgi:spoIIIJ-associated protein
VEWVVTTGRTVPEAVEWALDRLGVDEQDAEIEIIQEPQKGLFGRLRAEAQVRARVRPTTPRPKVDRRERRRAERRVRDGERNRSKTRSAGPVAGTDGDGRGRGPRRDGAVAKGDGDRASGGALVAAQTDMAGADKLAAVEAKRAPAPRSRRRRGSRTAEGANAVSESTQQTAPATAEFDIESQRQAVEGFLTDLLSAFGRSDATVTVTTGEDEAVEASVDGPELGLLVGQKGVTLQAVQELVRSMVQRRFVGQTHARVRLDVAGYRARRKVALERFAREVAESVKASGVAKALDPMGSADRKVIHDAVNEIEGVSTASEGEEAARRVVIRPG